MANHLDGRAWKPDDEIRLVHMATQSYLTQFEVTNHPLPQLTTKDGYRLVSKVAQEGPGPGGIFKLEIIAKGDSNTLKNGNTIRIYSTDRGSLLSATILLTETIASDGHQSASLFRA